MESELIKEVNAMEVLQKSRLFQGMSPEEITGCLAAWLRRSNAMKRAVLL